MKKQQLKPKNNKRNSFISCLRQAWFILNLLPAAGTVCLLTLILSFSSFGQTTSKGFQWIRHHGDDIDFAPEKVEDIQTDKWGNIYVAGQVNDIFVRDSNGTIIQSKAFPGFDSLENNGGVDAWIAKYSPQGDLLWQRYAGSGADDNYYDMVADQEGNSYMSGRLATHSLRKAKSFDNEEVSSLNIGSYIAKLDKDGNLQWHRSFGGDSIGNFLREYLLRVYELKLVDDQLIAFISGGGQHVFSYQKLFGLDSLKQGYHELKFNLDGEYLSAKTFPFANDLQTILPTSIQSNKKGYFITGVFNTDTLLVGNDTLIKENVDNALVLGFDTNMRHILSFQSKNYFDQLRAASLFGDTLIAAGHYGLFVNSTVIFDTITHTGSNRAFQEGACFVFNSTGKLLGLYPSKSRGQHTSTMAAAKINSNYIGIGGSFNHELTYSNGTNYMEAVTKCTNCTNKDLFFAVFDRNGGLVVEDYIYSSGIGTDGTVAIHFNDSMLYIGGFIGDTAIIPGIDTFVTRGSQDAFVAAYHLGNITSLKENSGYVKADNGILAYPIPTQGQVTLMGKAVNNEAQLYSISGQLIKTYRLDINAFRQSINLENVERGVYFLLIIGENEKQMVKIVKE